MEPYRQKQCRRASCQLGFTLIEMAIVVLVFGLLFGGGLVASVPLLQRLHKMETEKKLAIVQNALLTYVIQQGALPCPAQTITDGDGTCTGIAAETGFVPWRILGLQKSDVTDGWGRFFTYAADGAYMTPAEGGTLSLACAVGGAPVEAWANLLANINVKDEDGAVPGGNENNPHSAKAAYVLVSHGANGKGGTMRSGSVFSANGAAAGAELANTRMGDHDTGATTPPPVFYVAPDPSNVVVGFDDVVVSQTPAQILVHVGCTGQ